MPSSLVVAVEAEVVAAGLLPLFFNRLTLVQVVLHHLPLLHAVAVEVAAADVEEAVVAVAEDRKE